MKKYLITTLSLFAFIIPLVSNAEIPEVYVNGLNTEKTSYSVGDKVKGSFDVFNVSDFSQGDVFYTIYAGEYHKNGVDVLDTISPTSKLGPLFLDKESSQTVNFEYSLPSYVNGDLGIEVVVQMKDGTILGWQNVPIEVTGEVTQKRINVLNYSLKLDEQNYESLSGPTVSKEGKIFLSIEFESITDPIDLQPVIHLYDRVHNSELIKSINLESVTLSKEEGFQVDLELPVDLSPLVYAGVVEFKGSGVAVDPVYIKYIMEGDIATIRNVTTNTDSIKNGSLKVVVDYSGIPVNINNPDAQNTITEGNLEIIVKDLNGVIIGRINTSIDLQESKTVDIEVPVDYRKGSFKVESLISKDGNVLSSYDTEFPGAKEATGFDFIGILIGLATLILLLLLFKTVKNKMKEHIVAILIIFSSIFGSVIILTPAGVVEAFDTVLDKLIKSSEVSSLALNDGARYSVFDFSDINITSVQSPVPGAVKKYTPGEAFYINASATFLACGNGTSLSLIGPQSANNWNLGEDYYKTQTLSWWNASAFKQTQETSEDVNNAVLFDKKFTLASTSVGPYYAPTEPGTYDFYFLVKGITGSSNHVQLVKQTIVVDVQTISCTSDGTLAPLNTKDSISLVSIESPLSPENKIYQPGEQFTLSYKSKRGNSGTGRDLDVYFQPTTSQWWNQTPLIYNGPYSSNGYFSDALKFDEMKSWWNSNGTYFSSNAKNFSDGITSYGPYTVPNEPGYQSIYFMFGHSNFNIEKTVFACKQICVAGNGTCPNEPPPTDMCPNITGEQSTIPDNYALDLDGNCVEEEAETFEVSCSVSPTTAKTGVSVTFSSSVSGATGSVSYEWINTSGNDSNHSGQNFTKSYSSEGTYIYQIEATDQTGTTFSDDCGISVNNGNSNNNPDDSGGPNNSDNSNNLKINDFHFSPALVKSNESCNLVLDTQNATSCSMGGVPLEGTEFNVSDEKTFGPGTYSVSCSGANGSTVTAGPKKCTRLGEVIEQ